MKEIGGYFELELLAQQNGSFLLNVLTELKSEGENPYYIYGNEYGAGNEKVLASTYVDVVKDVNLYEKVII